MDTPYIFYFAVSQCTPIVIITVTGGMLQIQILAPVCFHAFGKRQQGTAVHVSGDGHIGCIEESGKNITQLYGSVCFSRCNVVGRRPFHDVWHMSGALVWIGLSPVIMVAHHIAMIGNEND